MTPKELEYHNTMVINAVLNSLIAHFETLEDDGPIEFRAPDVAEEINRMRQWFHSTTEARLNQIYAGLRQPLQSPTAQPKE